MVNSLFFIRNLGKHNVTWEILEKRHLSGNFGERKIAMGNFSLINFEN